MLIRTVALEKIILCRMIICLGPTGAGKTLLLRKLQQEEPYTSAIDDIVSTIPTAGTNIATLKVGKKKTLAIHELGGSMAPIWYCHYNDCSGVLFVIDTSNLQQISCACIQLLEVLSHKQLEESKMLIVLNKMDIKTSITLLEIKFILRLDEISKHSKQELHIVECSCLTGKGLDEIKLWLNQFSDYFMK